MFRTPTDTMENCYRERAVIIPWVSGAYLDVSSAQTSASAQLPTDSAIAPLLPARA